MVDQRRRGQPGRIVHIDNLPLGRIDLVGHVRHRGDHVHVELAEQALLHNLKVQQPEETAAEARTQRKRTLGFIDEGGVVELELLEHRAQLLELVGLHGVHSREHHGLDFLEAGYGLGTGIRHMSDGVADLDLGGALDAGNHIAHVAATYLPGGDELHLEHADFLDLVFAAGGEELDLVALAYAAVLHLAVGDHAAEGVEHRIEDQGLERGLRITLRRRNSVDYRVENRGHPLSGARRDLEHLLRLAAQQVAHLVGHDLHLGGIHVYLVQNRDDLQTVVYSHVEIGDGLGLHALGRVHNEQRAFTRRDGAGDLVGEVHMARSIDQIEPVVLASAAVEHLDRVALDGYSLLLLKVHVIEDLVLHVAFAERSGELQQPVGQGALAVVDMRDYAKVAYVLHFHIRRQR